MQQNDLIQELQQHINKPMEEERQGEVLELAQTTDKTKNKHFYIESRIFLYSNRIVVFLIRIDLIHI